MDNATNRINNQLQSQRKLNEALEKTTNLPVSAIHPDPEQPRRIIPVQYRSIVASEGYALALATWWQDETPNTDAYDFIERAAGEAASSEEDDGVKENTIVALMQLAASIKARGLTNPITVVPDGPGKFKIETGERRWWAHQILIALYPDDYRWQTIKATTKHSMDRWRQADENNSRDDLNAIGKTRQLAILLMELHRENGMSFMPRNRFGHERDYYAQVAEMQPPPGTNDRLLAGMGFANRSQTSRYKKLLLLEPEIWDAADAENWSLETCLRHIPGDEKNNVASSNNRPKQPKKRSKSSNFHHVSDALTKAQEATTETRRQQWIEKAEKGIREMIEALENLKRESGA